MKHNIYKSAAQVTVLSTVEKALLVGEELLNPTSLKEIFKRGSTSTATSKKLSSATVRDLTLAKLYGGLTGYDIAGFTFD